MFSRGREVCIQACDAGDRRRALTSPPPHLPGRVSGDVVAAIVQKAIAAPKTSTREKARELLLMVVEIEKYELVQEELVKGFSQKNPKVVAACIGALTLALRWVGRSERARANVPPPPPLSALYANI